MVGVVYVCDMRCRGEYLRSNVMVEEGSVGGVPSSGMNRQVRVIQVIYPVGLFAVEVSSGRYDLHVGRCGIAA